MLTEHQIDTGSLNYLWGLSIIHGFSLTGIQHAVISPGSRSTPLTLACERHPDIKTWVQVDERSAAFFALGLATRNRHPVILICTSGSAVANWFPAVVEANYSEIPLVLLSADRPAELQDCGANQTIDQQYLFGSHVRAFHALPEPSAELLKSAYLSQLVARSENQSRQQIPGPVHLNIPFREPLLPVDEDLNERIDELTSTIVRERKPVSAISSQSTPRQQDVSPLIELIARGDGIIVVGRKTYSAAFVQNLNRLAEILDVPVLVDHLSNLRFGKHHKTNFIVNYDLFLGSPDIEQQLGYKPGWVIRFGQFPVSRSLATYLSSLANAVTILVADNTRRHDPILSANYFVQSSADAFCSLLLQQLKPGLTSRNLLASFSKLEAEATHAITKTLNRKNGLFEGNLVFMLVEKLIEDTFIFVANSTAVRELDSFTVLNEHSHKSLSIYCNRGASGIDGNLSTYLGILAENRGSVGIALLGDLAFFHDMNGLSLCNELNNKGYSGTIIIVNNGGGHIFNYLPQRKLREFEQYWLAPRNMDIAHAAALFGLKYQMANDVESLDLALDNSLNSQGINIIEAVIDQKTSLDSHEYLLNA